MQNLKNAKNVSPYINTNIYKKNFFLVKTFYKDVNRAYSSNRLLRTVFNK